MLHHSCDLFDDSRSMHVQDAAIGVKTAGLKALGQTADVCPHCAKVLSKRPSRKAVCPHCNEFIYVRTRPQDRLRVLVTKAEADAIEAQWPIFTAWAESERQLDKEKLARARASLTDKFELKFGRRPSEADVAWFYLGQESLHYAAERQWGLYRNIRLDMAAFLAHEDRASEALRRYLEVCYIDLNGPENTGSAARRNFRPEFAVFAPVVVARAAAIIRALELDFDVARETFFKVAQPMCDGLHLPIEPARGWEMLAPELRNAEHLWPAG